MSVSVAHIKTNDDEPVMSWTLTVPCRISAELWPCQLEADGQCREMKGIKQQHLKDWEENNTMLWVNIWEYVKFDMNGMSATIGFSIGKSIFNNNLKTFKDSFAVSYKVVNR